METKTALVLIDVLRGLIEGFEDLWRAFCRRSPSSSSADAGGVDLTPLGIVVNAIAPAQSTPRRTTSREIARSGQRCSATVAYRVRWLLSRSFWRPTSAASWSARRSSATGPPVEPQAGASLR
jgi:hypothetical protein